MKVIIVISILISINYLLAQEQSQSQSQPLYFRQHDPCTDPENCPGNPCDPKRCKLPVCFCSGTAIPGGIQPRKVPQMIVLTFQNGIRNEDMPQYKKLFYGRKNPNGCPATGTFFVSHEYTDYFSVQTLASWRQEIGVNGILYRNISWWKSASKQNWVDDMAGEKRIVSLLANVPQGSILGERAPFLQMGGDTQMEALKSALFMYDASRVSINYTHSPNLLWPYTYDYDSIQDCVIGPCPKKSVKGLWQVPLLALKDRAGHFCATLDACNATSISQVFQLLHSAFVDHYVSNRAPLVLTLSARWVKNENNLQGTLFFLEYIKGLQDVYIVSLEKMFQWIWKPTPVDSLNTFQPWQCKDNPPSVCAEKDAILCKYDKNRHLVASWSAVKYSTRTCLKKCPPCYPWVGDSDGKKC